MSEAPRKQRGPITLFCENRRIRLAVSLIALLPVVYLASFGPAGWISSRFDRGADLVSAMYQPIVWVRDHTPLGGFRSALDWYSELAAADDWHWIMVVEFKTGTMETRWTTMDRERARRYAARLRDQ